MMGTKVRLFGPLEHASLEHLVPTDHSIARLTEPSTSPLCATSCGPATLLVDGLPSIQSCSSGSN